MACYISSNQNRFYATLESGFGSVVEATADNRIPAIRLGTRSRSPRWILACAGASSSKPMV